MRYGGTTKKISYKTTAKKKGRGVAVATWNKIAESRECAPEFMLEIYHYARDPAFLDLLRNFARLDPADQLATQHVLRRLAVAGRCSPPHSRVGDFGNMIN